MKNENMKKNNKGFSLVELIVVIAIMAVLMVILAPAMLRYVEKTRVQKDESALSEVANAAELALGEETIYSAVVGASKTSVVLTVTASDISEDTGITDSPVATDVKKTVGNGIKFASKTYKDASSIKVKLVYDTTKDAFVVATTTAGKPFDSDDTKLVSY